MKPRRGPLGRAAGAVAQGIAGAARRRQDEREPRVVLYDRAGHPTLLRPGPDRDRIAETASRLIAFASPASEAPDA